MHSGACPFSVAFGQGCKFNGKERDTETGLDYFEARHYASNMGRFMTPDPDAGGQPDNDPQTFNLYAYGLNNPIRYGDEHGYDAVDRVNRADATLGKPYEMGAKGPDAYDCSGVCSRSAGPDVSGLPNGSSQQYEFAVSHGLFTTDASHVKAGDEVFFKDANGHVHHVGVVSSVNKDGTITIVHAPGHDAKGHPRPVQHATLGAKAGSSFGSQKVLGYGMWHNLDHPASGSAGSSSSSTSGSGLFQWLVNLWHAGVNFTSGTPEGTVTSDWKPINPPKDDPTPQKCDPQGSGNCTAPH
jgi:RHS repeat-associated protein